MSRSRRLILALGLCAAQLTLLSLLWEVGEARADAVPVPILEDAPLEEGPPVEPPVVSQVAAEQGAGATTEEGAVVPVPAPAPAPAPVKKALPVKSMGGY